MVNTVVSLCLTFLLTMPTGDVSDVLTGFVHSVCRNDNSSYSLTLSWRSGIEYLRPNPSPVFYFYLTKNGWPSGKFTRTIKTKKMVILKLSFAGDFMNLNSLINIYNVMYTGRKLHNIIQITMVMVESVPRMSY